jgi:hypothetical protein
LTAPCVSIMALRITSPWILAVRAFIALLHATLLTLCTQSDQTQVCFSAKLPLDRRLWHNSSVPVWFDRFVLVVLAGAFTHYSTLRHTVRAQVLTFAKLTA